jgi:hypothetical protein
MGRALEEVIYYVATAKFMAEKSLGVGPNTVMCVMARNGGIAFIQPGELESIRRLWVSEGAPQLPKTAKRIVSELMTGKEFQNI